MPRQVHIVGADQVTIWPHWGHKHIFEKAPDDVVHLCATYGEAALRLIGLLQSGYWYFGYSYLHCEFVYVIGLTLFLNK